MADTPPWTVSSALWDQVLPLIPPAPSHAKGGRPRMPDRQAFEAIVYILRTGIPWNALPSEIGARSTVHDRFLEWRRQGFFQALQHAELQGADELQGIDWGRQAADEVPVSAPVGRPHHPERADGGDHGLIDRHCPAMPTAKALRQALRGTHRHYLEPAT